jgi:hypothetical protein
MLSKYVKAIVAFLGVLVTGIAAVNSVVTSIADNPDIAAVLPPNFVGYVYAVSGSLVVAGTVVTGVIAFFVRNQKTVDQIDKAIEAGDFTLSDLESLISKKRAAE